MLIEVNVQEWSILPILSIGTLVPVINDITLCLFKLMWELFNLSVPSTLIRLRISYALSAAWASCCYLSGNSNVKIFHGRYFTSPFIQFNAAIHMYSFDISFMNSSDVFFSRSDVILPSHYWSHRLQFLFFIQLCVIIS